MSWSKRKKRFLRGRKWLALLRVMEGSSKRKAEENPVMLATRGHWRLYWFSVAAVTNTIDSAV